MHALDISRLLQQVRSQRPLVLNITNYVVMNNTANALLALGASPVMAHAQEEVEELAGLARAVVLNIGTLSPAWVEAMYKAGETARRWGKPLILDPVGAGASRYRSQTALSLLTRCAPTVVRGNASEILALAGCEGHTQGVDSATGLEERALEAARQLASSHHNVVVISGPTDYITNGEQVARITNGHPLMPRVTGLGCTATALMGAFAAIEPQAMQAAQATMAVMGIAGERAGARAQGVGSFQMHFLDALTTLSHKDIQELYQENL